MATITPSTSVLQNQLFKRPIPISILEKVVTVFGLTDLEDKRWFSKVTMQTTKTVEKMNELAKTLMDYYLPCKARNYLHIITDKICITILRQILREYDYTLHSKETYRNKKKQILYCVQKKDAVVLVKRTRSNSPLNNTVCKPVLRNTITIQNEPNYTISFND